MDITSGIRVEATENFVLPIVDSFNEVGIQVNVFFDWDRTLTQQEGLIIGRSEGFSSVVDLIKSKIAIERPLTLEGYAEFLMGSYDRFQEMKGFLRALYDRSVNIYVLTNNTGCPQNKMLFEELGFALLPGIGFTDIICGASFQYLKRKALLSEVPSAC